MNKKELRKELELLLVRSIEIVLSNKNDAAAKSIRKNTLHASKTLAKKFYKSLKTKPVRLTGRKAVKVPVKKSAKTAIKKTVSATKRPSAKAKNKK